MFFWVFSENNKKMRFKQAKNVEKKFKNIFILGTVWVTDIGATSRPNISG
jgi:hypothetical protein